MSSEPLNLSPSFCLERQNRVRDVLDHLSVEKACFCSHESIQYLTGFRPHRLMQAALVLETDGDCILAAPNAEPEHAVADRILTFPAQRLATLRQDQMAAAVSVLMDEVGTDAKHRIGVEFSSGTLWVHRLVDDFKLLVNLDAEMWQLRRRKDPDELTLIRRAIDCTEAMYRKAREIIEPGITELEVFNQLHRSAVGVAGEPLSALGNDYQSNSPGGPPRNRPAQAGELFILDLGPAYRGYYADNCRTIAVDRKPTDEQLTAWGVIVSALNRVEEMVRPGVSCQTVYAEVKAMLDDYHPDAFFHHLGHGFGLYPHETPHLNPHWEDVFEEGDVFTAEPGLYAEELRAGIRLEQDYLVTDDGVERLTDFPLELGT